MSKVHSGAPFDLRPEDELPPSVITMEIEEERIQLASPHKRTPRRRSLHWPTLRSPFVILLIAVLAVSTVMLPFLVWVIAPFLLVGVAISAWSSRVR